jgi:hypothetical protein
LIALTVLVFSIGEDNIVSGRKRGIGRKTKTNLGNKIGKSWKRFN